MFEKFLGKLYKIFDELNEMLREFSRKFSETFFNKEQVVDFIIFFSGYYSV